MASTFFKNFAIEHNLTIDYGFMYGRYRDFFITLKETLGSTKILSIYTDVGQNKEEAKKILGVFSSEELPKYCITDFKVTEDYIQFTFELVGDRIKLIVEFMDRFMDSYIENGHKAQVLCPICKKVIKADDEIAIIDKGGQIVMAHASCFEQGKKQAEEKAQEENVKEEESENKVNRTFAKGLIGAIVFSLLYMGLLSMLFFFMQFILMNVESDDSFVVILQYLPVVGGLAACPIIYYGYERFNGKRGTSKYIIILWCVIISTIIGTILGFILSFTLSTDYSVKELFDIIGILLTGGYKSFKLGFYIYLFVTLGLAILSMVFKFQGKAEADKSNDQTFEKLD